MKKCIFLIFALFVLRALSLTAQVYSFEDAAVPSSWTVTGGTLEATTEKYKIGKQSLAWSWNQSSVITATSLNNLSAASTTRDGGFHFWVYNANPVNSSIKFSFMNSSNVLKCKMDFNLNFKGWRCFLCRFRDDYGHDNSLLTKMTVQAPPIGSGKLYFDYFNFITVVDFSRNSDAQYRYNRDAPWPDVATRQASWNFGSLSSVSSEQIAGVDTIIKRLDNWFYGTGKFSSAPEYNIRKGSLQKNVTTSLSSNNPDMNLIVGSDGVVSGPSLFSTRLAVTHPVSGESLRTFAGPNQFTVYQQALDYSLTKSEASKTRWLNTLNWMYDQGWADGSGLGSLYYEGLRWVGYPFSIYMMRKELNPDQLYNNLNILHSYGAQGIYLKYPWIGCNSDIIRTTAIAKFAFATMQADPKRRIEAMITLQGFYNNSFLVHHGFGEAFKPDYSGYHHAGVYFSAYYPNALYVACFVYYLLHDTPYALPESVYITLKNSLLAMRSVCATYSCPTATNGRFPNPSNTLVMSNILPAFACLALSKSQADAELMAAFKRLWKPTVNPVSAYLYNSNTADVPRTLGEVEICLQAAALNVPAESNPKMSFFMPYAGLMVNRNNTRLVSVKGFSKFVSDFEQDGTVRDGLLNRYQSYGQIEITNIQTGRRNNAYELIDGYDWSRLPGTTSKYLLPDVLKVGKGNNFSDESFLGGASMNDSVSMFSMKLHDNTFDKTFRANKSVFCFGNVMLCLGSNICNNATNTKTETTLLQHVVNSGESFKVNGSELVSNQTGLLQPIIRDNLGTRFIVKSGTVDIYKKGTVNAAVINHGSAPKNMDYMYYMLLNVDDVQEAKYSNPVTCPVSVLRQDSVAHIVKQAELNTTCYAIFNSTADLNDALVANVNIPSVVMAKLDVNGDCDLVVSDPDMHRGSAPYLDALTYHGSVYEAPSAPFNYEIVLNGLYDLNDVSSGVTLTKTGNTTKIELTAIEGKAYKVHLKKAASINISTGQITPNASSKYLVNTTGENIFTISSKSDSKFGISVYSIDGRLVKTVRNLLTGYPLNLTSMPSGVYIISLDDDVDSNRVKVVVE